MATAVEKALALTTTVTNGPEETSAEIVKLRQIERELLPCEFFARDELQTRIQALEMMEQASKIGLPVLDPIVLTWRCGKLHGIPVPTFAPIPVTDNRVQWVCKRQHSKSGTDFISGTTHLEKLSTTAWRDVRRKILKKTRRFAETTVRFGYTFNGVIPLETRAKIKAEQTTLRWEAIYLLAETSRREWDFSHHVDHAARRAYYRDPIVVGLSYGRMYVIDTFDPTSLESYVLSEFTS